MNVTLLLLFAVCLVFVSVDSHIQIHGEPVNSPFETKFGDIKFLDAYFGTLDEKIEVEPGDSNMPFTVVLANVGTQDIAGIKGQLSLPLGFSASDGRGSVVHADSDSNSVAGANFHLTFFVNLDKNIQIQQYPGTIKIDYSRLRQSGVRTAFADFDFKVTGDSLINVKATEPFLTSLKSNSVTIEISNDGTAPISGVEIVTISPQAEAMTSSSITNMKNVVISESNWNVGHIAPKSSGRFTATVYVPESISDDTMQLPLSVSYYNAHGDQKTVTKIVDFYIKGLIDLRIFNVKVIELSGRQMLIGDIINEGNEDGLFGFVTVDPSGDSNIKSDTQFIDEIETDGPVPFNIPVEFDGPPVYGEHDITIAVRYKDSVRDEIILTHNATVFVAEPPASDSEGTSLVVLAVPIALAGLAGFYVVRRRKMAATGSRS